MKVSIIVPVYNVEKYIKRCLDSILAQTFEDWEAIVVNDGSTDGSDGICKKYSEKDKRIVYINQDNKGLSGARNTGLKIAKGDYVCFIDSDDWIETDYLSEMYKQMKKNKCDLVICGYFQSTDNHDIPYKIDVNQRELNTKELIHHVARNNIQSFAWNKLYTIGLLKNFSFKEGAFYEDVLMMNEIMPEIRKTIIIDNPLYHYYMRDNSIIHTRNIRRERDYFNAFKERYELDYISENDKTEILKLLMIEFYYIAQVEPLALEEFKCYLKKQPQQTRIKSENLLSFKEKIRYKMAWNFPKFYKRIVNVIR